MKEELQELYKYRELLYMIAYRDIKVRYKQSIMGFLWADSDADLDCSLRRRGPLCVCHGCAYATQDGGHRKRGGKVASLGISGFQHSIFLSEPDQQQRIW